MRNIVKKKIKKVVGDMVNKVLAAPVMGIVAVFGALFEVLLDMFMVLLGVLLAIIFLFLALIVWLAGYVFTAMAMVTLVLTLTIMARTPNQKEKVIQVIDILTAVEISFILVFYTGLTLPTCTLLLSAIVLAGNIR